MPSFHDKRKCFWFSRWFTYSASFINLFTGGTTYLWGTYSDDIKSVMGLDQSQISLLGVSFYFAQLGNFFVGLSYDVFGPRPLGWMSAIFMFSGYFLFRQGVIDKWPVPVMCMSLIIVGLGSNGIYTASVPTNINNFHIKHKGKVVGSLLTMTGLSAAVLSAVYKYKFTPLYDDLQTRLVNYLLMLAVLLGCSASFATLFLNVEPKEEDLRRSRWSRMPAVEKMSRLSYQKYLSEQEASSRPRSRRQSVVRESMDEESNPLLINTIDEALDEWTFSNFGSLANEFVSKEEFLQVAFPQYKWHESLRTVNFWLFFPSQMVAAAAGVMVISIVSQLVKSLSLDPDHIPILVSLIAVVNAASRLITGVVSDLLARFVTRPLFFAFFAALFACTHIWLSFSTQVWQIYVAAILIGYCYGSIVLLYSFILLVLIIDFPNFIHTGIQSLLMNYLVTNIGELISITSKALFNMGPAGGNYLFASVIASKIYQSNIPDSQEDKKYCYGVQCFKSTFIITSVCCVIAVALLLLLWHRTRRIYTLKYRGGLVNLKK